ncbi:MAG: cytochrome b N-terminal domain-containing protein [Bacteroidetes bacterium]|nr:cytochrome b N-terminal domain-containing protein [Bacteroidota bacterium]MCX6306429.1 cytochrome b N-terminal domain-containing protein [Bacteroidota bacterium]
MRSVLLHLHPAKVSAAALRLRRTFGLGGMAALLIFMQVITGIMLRFYYVPNPAEAYNSILLLKNHVLFGQFIRNIHYWSGVFLLLIAFLHFLRVFFTGAYRGIRTINWLFGLILLILIVAANFTGYLLPWDQLAYWAITVSTNIIGYLPWAGKSLRTFIIGGRELDAGTLQNFFTFHTAVVPLLLITLAIYHFWRVRKAGGILLPGSTEKPDMVPVVPNLVFRELIASLLLMAVLFTFAAVFNAPLLEKANPAYSMNPTKAPWYFGGVQELLMHFHPFFAAFVIPLAVLVFLSAIPFIKYDEEPVGQWFYSDLGKKSSKSTMLFAGFITLAGILFNAYVFNFEIMMPGMPAVISNGIIPLLILLLFMTAYYRFCLGPLKLSKPELVQAAFVFIMIAFIVLTVVGVFFRGKDMELTWPWRV